MDFQSFAIPTGRLEQCARMAQKYEKYEKYALTHCLNTLPLEP